MDRYIDRLYYDAIVKIISTENPHLPTGKVMGNHRLHCGHCKAAWVFELAKKTPIWARRLGSRGMVAVILQDVHRLLLTSLFVRACIWVRARVYLCAFLYFFCDDYWNKKQKDSTQHLNFFHLLGLYADKTEWAFTGLSPLNTAVRKNEFQRNLAS